MITLAKYVLLAVSNQPELLVKEYHKFLNWLQPTEICALTEWCLQNLSFEQLSKLGLANSC